MLVRKQSNQNPKTNTANIPGPRPSILPKTQLVTTHTTYQETAIDEVVDTRQTHKNTAQNASSLRLSFLEWIFFIQLSACPFDNTAFCSVCGGCVRKSG